MPLGPDEATAIPIGSLKTRKGTVPAVMLPRPARSPCWRTTTPFIHPTRVVPRSTPWRSAYYGSQFRVITSSQSSLRRQVAGDKPTTITDTQTAAKATLDEKNAQNATATKKKDLLSEASMGNKEQRKADWAIMKEMAKYLWPKVRTV